MASEAFQAFVRNRSRTATILWAALMASVAIYGGVLFWLVNQPFKDAPATPESLRTLSIVLGVVALPLGAMSIIMPRMALSPERLRERLPAKPMENIVVEGEGGHATMISLAGMTPAESRAARVVHEVALTPHIIGMVIAESVALMGMALGIMAHEMTIATPFLFASGALMVMRLPRVEATAGWLLGEAERTQALEAK